MTEAKIKLVSGEGLKQKIEIIGDGKFLLASDAHKNIGGDYSAPAPYDYLLTSLAACTAMTIQIYAKRKNIPLARVEIELEIKKVETENATKIDFIKKNISLFGDLSQEEKQKLLEIADKCPVNRTLQNGIKSETLLG